MIRSYNSIADFCDDIDRCDTSAMRYAQHSGSWANGENFSIAMQKSRYGNTSLVPAAEALMSQLESQIEVPRKVWDRSPAGAFAIVPEVLAGLPTPMRRQREVLDERQPLTIIVVTTSSAGIKAETLMKRGTAILALTMAMARIRPITLHALSMLDGHVDGTGEILLKSQINTAPLDLSTAAYVLTSAGFDRILCHAHSQRLAKYRGGWPSKYRWGRKDQPYFDYLINVFGYEKKNTLLIGPTFLGDPIVNTPVAWVQDQIARFTNANEDQDYAA